MHTFMNTIPQKAIYERTRTYICIHMYIKTYVQTIKPRHIHAYILNFPYMHAVRHVCVYLCTCIHTTRNLRWFLQKTICRSEVCWYKNSRRSYLGTTELNSGNSLVTTDSQQHCVYIYPCINRCTYVYIFIQMYVYVCVYTCGCVYTYGSIYTIVCVLFC